MDEHRSGCPINLSLEVIGDSWSLIVIRDVMFGNRRHFRELATKSEEGIATNILTDRLRRLVGAGLLTKNPDPSHKQRRLYSLTEQSIQLVPVLATLGAWGSAWLPATPELRIRAEVLEAGGQELWDRFMDELRAMHLGAPRPVDGPSVFAQLEEAYQSEVARSASPLESRP